MFEDVEVIKNKFKKEFILTHQELETISRFESGLKQLNFPNFPVAKNPRYKALKDTDEMIAFENIIYPYQYFYADDFMNKFTLNDLLNTIVDGPLHLERPLKTSDKIQKFEQKQILEDATPLNIEAYKRYLNSIYPSSNNRKDMMSPPPYHSLQDSMGNLNTPEDYQEYGEAIIEVRKYGTYFNLSNRNLNQIKNFILLEAQGLFGYIYD